MSGGGKMEARPTWPLGGRGAFAEGMGTVDIMGARAAVLLEGWDVGDGMKARAAGAVTAARASRKASGRRRGIVVVVAGVCGWEARRVFGLSRTRALAIQSSSLVRCPAAAAVARLGVCWPVWCGVRWCAVVLGSVNGEALPP